MTSNSFPNFACLDGITDGASVSSWLFLSWIHSQQAQLNCLVCVVSQFEVLVSLAKITCLNEEVGMQQIRLKLIAQKPPVLILGLKNSLL